MNEFLDELTGDLVETAIEPDRYDIAEILKYLIPDDSFNFMNRQPEAADSPSEDALSLENLRRNMNQNKEPDKR